MSSFQDASWIRRLWSLAAPGAPVADYIQSVNLVNDGRFRSSRERAPFASVGTSLLGAAGEHGYLELTGTDRFTGSNPVGLLQYFRGIAAQSTLLSGYFSWGVTTPAAVVSRTSIPIIFGDRDDEITCAAFSGTVTTANLPAARNVIPPTASHGLTNATPSFPFLMTELCCIPSLNFATAWNLPASLFFFSETPNAIVNFMATWQVMRS